MIDNDLVQAALIKKVDTSPIVTAYIASGTVTEYQWQAYSGSYPMARIQIESQVDTIPGSSSCPSQIEFSWFILSEKPQSKEANQIAGAFVRAFRDLSFSENNIKFVRVRILENIPAIHENPRTWRAQVRCQSVIHED